MPLLTGQVKPACIAALSFSDPRGKGLQFGKATPCDLFQPGIEARSLAPMEHVSEVLNEGIRARKRRTGLTEQGQSSCSLSSSVLGSRMNKQTAVFAEYFRSRSGLTEALTSACLRVFR